MPLHCFGQRDAYGARSQCGAVLIALRCVVNFLVLTMRQASSALLALLMVAIVTASLAPIPAPTTAPSASATPRPEGMWAVERLVREFAFAVSRHDIKGAAELLDDNATIWLGPITGCGPISKSAFVAQLNNSEIASQIVVFLENTVSAGLGVFHYENAFLAAGDSQWANRTFDRRRQVLAATATADGQRLTMIREINDQSQNQVNASALMDVWWAWANASVASNVSELDAVLGATSLYAIYEPNAKDVHVLNRTQVLLDAAQTKEDRLWLYVSYDFVFPTCSTVAALVTSFAVQKNGARFVNKGFFAIHVDENMKVAQVDSIPLFLR